jgi:recombination protein RecT
MANEQQIQKAAPTNKAIVEQKNAKQAMTKTQVLAEAIAARRDSFAAVATEYLKPDRLVKLAQACIARNPLLAECEASSILVELMACSRLGLEPNEAGGRWLVPFKNNHTDKYECQGITDYRALIDIARRSGVLTAVHADVVREGDLWENWIASDGPTLVHLRHQVAQERGEIRYVYAIAKLKSGEVQTSVLTLADVTRAKGKSRGADSNSSPWKNEWDAMAKKTALRRLFNLLPKSPEIQKVREQLDLEEPEDGKERTAAQELAAQEVAAADAAAATAALAGVTHDPKADEKGKVLARAKALRDAAEQKAPAAQQTVDATVDQATDTAKVADVPGWELTPPDGD